MGELWQGILWLFDAATHQGKYALGVLFIEHLGLTFLALLPAILIALPLGALIGVTNKGAGLVVSVSSVSRAIPTLGLLLGLVLWLGVTQRMLATAIALAVIAIAPLLAATYAGIGGVSRGLVDAARAQGMVTLQIVRHVQAPLALPQIVGGLRIAWLQVVSTVVLAPLVGLGGLGFGIVQGLALRNYPQVVGSALVIVMLTISIDRLLAVVQRKISLKNGGVRRTLDA
jgi:osmoprotectant transport system permease protein